MKAIDAHTVPKQHFATWLSVSTGKPKTREMPPPPKILSRKKSYRFCANKILVVQEKLKKLAPVVREKCSFPASDFKAQRTDSAEQRKKLKCKPAASKQITEAMPAFKAEMSNFRREWAGSYRKI